MASEVYLRKGTGASCRICNKKIFKYQGQVNFKGYNSSAVIHSDPMDCNWERQQQALNSPTDMEGKVIK